MFPEKMRIGLRTANLLMYVKSEGIVIDEPSVIAIDAEARKYLTAGQDTRDMLGRTPDRVLAIHPPKDGAIVDFEVTKIMLSFFFKKLAIRGVFGHPIILVCCPNSITSVERNAICDAAYRAGAKEVYVEGEPKVVAIDAGLDIGKPSGCMILDIGGGTTNIAVVSLGEIVSSTSLKIVGDMLDRDIIKLVKKNKKLLTGDCTAEEVKKQIGTVRKGSMYETIEVSGHNLIAGLPATITLSNEEIQSSMVESLQDVVRACKTVPEQTPPELASDIVTKDIVLTGGGALPHGVGGLLHNELHVPIYTTENALRCVAKGTEILFENLHLVQQKIKARYLYGLAEIPDYSIGLIRTDYFFSENRHLLTGYLYTDE